MVRNEEARKVGWQQPWEGPVGSDSPRLQPCPLSVLKDLYEDCVCTLASQKPMEVFPFLLGNKVFLAWVFWQGWKMGPPAPSPVRNNNFYSNKAFVTLFLWLSLIPVWKFMRIHSLPDSTGGVPEICTIIMRASLTNKLKISPQISQSQGPKWRELFSPGPNFPWVHS